MHAPTAVGGGSRCRQRRAWSIRPRALALLFAVVLLATPQYAVAAGSRAVSIARSGPLTIGGTGGSAPASNFPTYLDNDARTGSAGWQGPLTVSDAHNLHVLWTFAAGGSVWGQPIVANGVVFVGARDGYEYAVKLSTGGLLWKTFLGLDNATPACGGALGITSTATDIGQTLYLNGGDSDFYALSASTGHIAWSLPVGGAETSGFYLWSSPLISNHSAYVAIASRCDDPLVPAGLERVSLETHQEIAYFNSSQPDPNGSSIWGSPSLDAKTGSVFVSTGNPYGSLGSTYSESLVSLNGSSLRPQASWQVPANQSISDGDFGATPTLFDTANGTPIVTAENKNGYLYAWYQSNLTLLWEDKIAADADDHYPTAEVNGRLFAVGGSFTSGGVTYNSSISAINPATGAFLWRVGTVSSPGSGYAGPLVVNGVVVVPIGHKLYVLEAADGQMLYTGSPGGLFVPPASVSVSRGEVFVGAGDDLVAYVF
jgi:polyvinyl alcohol dehydrogenase (cytochrome)